MVPGTESGSGSDSWAAVILSAGESARFGGRPKALLPVGPEVAIARIARVCLEAGAGRVIGVIGAHHDQIRPILDGSHIEAVENPGWAAGRTGSLQAGLDATQEVSEVLVWPVDHPFVAAGTVDRLRAAATRDALAVWFIPTFRGGSGHPVLIRGTAIARVRAMAAASPLRSLLPELGPQVRRVPVEDPGVLENVDSLDAYWSAIEAWKSREKESLGP